MNNIGVTINIADPFICAQMITQNIPDRQNRQKTFNDPLKIVIRGIQYQVSRSILRSHFCGKPAAKAPAIHDNVVFMVLLRQVVVDNLHVMEHFLFTALTGAFSKTPIIYKHHIIVIPIKILCILCPAFYTSCVAVKIKNKAERFFAIEMKTINPNTWFYIKKQFLERNIILELEVLL